MSACAKCGRDPALGFATINERRYCHGDEKPSCYELASREGLEGRLGALLGHDGQEGEGDG